MRYAPLSTLAQSDGLVNGIPLFQMIDGNVFYVDSGGSGVQADGSFNKPMTTIDGAINKCTAGNNDHIFVKAGHAETISDASSLNCDLADVAIIGMGHGNSRPRITFDTATTTTIPVTADNIMFKNIIFSANFADVAACFTLAAAEYFTLVDCSFTFTATNMNFVDIVDTSAVANAEDNLTFARCDFIDSDTGTGSLVNVDEDLDGLTILDCDVRLGVNGVLPCLADVAADKDLTDVNIQRNFTYRLVDGSAVTLIQVATTTANTGYIADNSSRHLDIADELTATAGTNFSFFRNKASGVIGLQGYLLPGTDS